MIFIRFIVVIIFFSTSYSYLSIKDEKIYNNISDIYYSHDEFIDSLVSNPNFKQDKYFKKYRNSNDRLKFKNSWYIYLLSIGSVGAGMEGIMHPERFEEGGENYDGPNTSTPGVGNIFFGALIYKGYIGYHTMTKDRSLYHVINKYNDLYSEEEIKLEEIPYKSFYVSKDNIVDVDNWNVDMSIGISERIPISFMSVSLLYDINNHSELFGSFSYLIFGGGLSLGFKYYLFDKFKLSPFVSNSVFTVGGGDTWQSTNGISIAPGISFTIPYINDMIDSKIALNLGMSFLFLDDPSFISNDNKSSYGKIPVINISFIR